MVNILEMSILNVEENHPKVNKAVKNYEAAASMQIEYPQTVDEDVELCLISMPAEMSLTMLDGVIVERDKISNICMSNEVITDISGDCKPTKYSLDFKQVSSTNNSKIVLHQDEGKNNTFVTFPKACIEISTLSEPSVACVDHCIPRPKPSMPDHVKNRLKLFGWKCPVGHRKSFMVGSDITNSTIKSERCLKQKKKKKHKAEMSDDSKTSDTNRKGKRSSRAKRKHESSVENIDQTYIKKPKKSQKKKQK